MKTSRRSLFGWLAGAAIAPVVADAAMPEAPKVPGPIKSARVYDWEPVDLFVGDMPCHTHTLTGEHTHSFVGLAPLNV